MLDFFIIENIPFYYSIIIFLFCLFIFSKKNSCTKLSMYWDFRSQDTVSLLYLNCSQEESAKHKTHNSLQTTTPVSARRLFFICGKKRLMENQTALVWKVAFLCQVENICVY